jgi:hypothetical protein
MMTCPKRDRPFAAVMFRPYAIDTTHTVPARPLLKELTIANLKTVRVVVITRAVASINLMDMDVVVTLAVVVAVVIVDTLREVIIAVDEGVASSVMGVGIGADTCILFICCHT